MGILRFVILIACLTITAYGLVESAIAQRVDPQILQDRINSLDREVARQRDQKDSLEVIALRVESRLTSLEVQSIQNGKLLLLVGAAIFGLGIDRLLGLRK